MKTMSLTRNAADKIASFVVRYASAGSKEWAQALRNELSCIENNWHALAWALGGLRVLFSIYPAPLRSIADLDAAARQHANRRLHAINNGWVATNVPLFSPLVCCLSAILGIAMHRDVLGNTAQLVGCLLLMPTLYLRSREPNVPDMDDQANVLQFYVNEMSLLSRNSLSFWMFIAGMISVAYGWDLVFARGLFGMVVLSFIPLSLMALFLAKHANNRRRYEQIEALLGKSYNH
jgi:hypothetical protein